MGGIEAGKAFIKFLLDDKEFKRGLSGAATSLKKFGAIGAAVTAPLIGAFTGAVAAFTSAGDELAKMSQRTGLSVESLSELKYAADQSGTSLSALENSTKKMQVGLLDASNGTGTLLEALTPLGLNLAELRGLKPEQQFLALARAIAGVEDPTQRAALAQKVFGRAGTELLPMLADGTAGLDALRERAHTLGLTMNTETANAAVKLGDNLADLKQQVFAIGVNIGAAVAGPLTDFAQVVQVVIGRVIEFIKENPRLVRGIGAITLAIGAASAASLTFGTILAVLTAHPIVAALAGIATMALLVAKYFGLIGDNAAQMQQSLDQIQLKAGSVAAPDQSGLLAAAEQTKLQLQAAVSQSVGGAPGAGMLAGLDRMFLESTKQVEKWTHETAQNTKKMLQIMQTGDAGFFAGVG